MRELVELGIDSPAYFDLWLITNDFRDRGSGGSIIASYGRNVLRGSTLGIDVDTSAYADSIIAEYAWTDTAGAQQRKTYITPSPGQTRKVTTVSFETADPGSDPTPGMQIQAARNRLTQELSIIPAPAYSGIANTPRPVGLGTIGVGHSRGRLRRLRHDDAANDQAGRNKSNRQTTHRFSPAVLFGLQCHRNLSTASALRRTAS